MTIIEQIREATKRAVHLPALDERFYHISDLKLQAWGFGEYAPAKILDVPVAAVHILGHTNALIPGETWRQALRIIEGENWDERVFDYFNNPVAGKGFLMPGSREELQFESIGGAIHCSCGIHRMIVGKCWLLATKGPNAVIRGASVSSRGQFNQAVRAFFLEKRAAEYSIFTGTGEFTFQGKYHVQRNNRVYFRRRFANRNELWQCDSGNLNLAAWHYVISNEMLRRGYEMFETWRGKRGRKIPAAEQRDYGWTPLSRALLDSLLASEPGR